MAKGSRPLRVRYRLEAECSIEAEKETLTRRILQVLSTMCDAVESEATQLPTPAAPTEKPRSCHFVVINFMCVFIYNFSCLDLVCVPCTIHFIDCYLALEFCVAYVGLLMCGSICTCPWAVFVRYAPYICALLVHYARYMLTRNAKSML